MYYLVYTANECRLRQNTFSGPLSTLLACMLRVTSDQSVLRRICGCGHFRSRDNGGVHTIRYAIAGNPYNTHISQLYLLQNRGYYQLNFSIAKMGNSRFFGEKQFKNINKLLAPRK